MDIGIMEIVERRRRRRRKTTQNQTRDAQIESYMESMLLLVYRIKLILDRNQIIASMIIDKFKGKKKLEKKDEALIYIAHTHTDRAYQKEASSCLVYHF